MHLYHYQSSKMEEMSDPKPNALERVLDFVPNGKCTAPMQLENLAADDVQKTSGEAKFEGYVCVGAQTVRSAEDSTKHLRCKDFPEYMKLCDPGPMELQAESSIGISSIPKQITVSHTHKFGSEIVNFEVRQENHVSALENTYHRPVKDQKSEFDRINMEQKETIPEEVIRNSFLEFSTSLIDDQSRKYKSDQSALPPENAAKDCKQIQLELQSDDDTKISGLEELVPGKLVDTGKRSRGRPRKVQTGLEQLLPGQTTDAKSSSHLGDTGKRSRGRPRKVQNSPTSFLDNINMVQKETIPKEVTQNSFLESLTSSKDYHSRNYNSDQSGLPPENAAKDCKHIHLGHQSDDATKISGLEELVISQKTFAKSPSLLVETGKRSRGRPRKVQTGLEQLLPGQTTDAKSSSHLGDTGKRSRGRPRKVQNSPTSFLDNIDMVQKETIPKEVTQNSFLESLTSPKDYHSRNYNSDQSGLPPENAAKDCKHIHLGHQSDDATKISGLEELVISQTTFAKSPSLLVETGKRSRGRPRKVQTGLEQLLPGQTTDAKSSSHLGDTGKRSRGRPRKVQNSPTSLGGSVKVLPEKRKDTQELLVNSSRSLRSRSQEKSIEPDLSNIVAEGADREKTRKKRKKRMEENRVDEFSRIRTHLRYLLHRIKYEKNFIDAYSGEGWKGQSLDKIKPEKELKRAKAEIFGRKLKIRDLFQRLDLSRSEGRLPAILFDPQGEIDSEDIFCAKCRSKDVTLSNDIILCDGACERGFHQYCLDPPLLKEYIPPDDEGWLCPGCECKIDCIKLLNDSQETNILLGDSWEKIFAEEAAAAASGKNLDDDSGLPSDDSEDDDYDPGGPDLNEKGQGDESSSDESDYHSASDDMQVLPLKEPCSGLPPDDSEDDDYDPSVLVDQMFKDSSCSDFTSDSEDFTAVFDDCKHSGKVQEPLTSTPDHVRHEEGCGHPGKGDAAPLYPRRQVESLDYKKLHDEEYGNTSSDSSDEDFMVTSSPDKKEYNSDKEATVLLNFESLTTDHEKVSGDMELDQKASESTHKRRYVKKVGVEGTNSSLSRSCEGSAAPVTSGKSTKKTLYGEHATQRLLQSFKENQYPQRAVKESLAAELALSVQQVSKWFDNTRWSFHHSLCSASGVAEFASNEGSPHQKSINLSGSSLKSVSDNATCSEVKKKEQDKGSPGVTEGCDRDVTLNMVADEGNGHIPGVTGSAK